LAGRAEARKIPLIVEDSQHSAEDSNRGLASDIRTALRMNPGQARLRELEERLLQAQVAKQLLHTESPPIVLAERYIVEEQIGGGAMGVVFRVYDTQLHTRRALKVLIDDGDDGECGRQRLMREAVAMAKLRDPHVVHAYDHREDDPKSGLTFLVMEFIDGTTLTRWLQSAQHRPRAVVVKLLGVARGLIAMHEKSLAHRDIKPDNLLVCAGDGPAIVGDLGLVRRMPEADAPPGSTDATTSSTQPFALKLTDDGTLVGTLAYMAPEQLVGGRGGRAQRSIQLLRRPLRGDLRLAPVPRGGCPRVDAGDPARRVGPPTAVVAAPGRAPRAAACPCGPAPVDVSGAEGPAARAMAPPVARGLRPWGERRCRTRVVDAACRRPVHRCRRAATPGLERGHAGSLACSVPRQRGLSLAEPAWQRFAGGVDEFAVDWSTRRRQTCSALQAATSATPEHWRRLAARQACEGSSALAAACLPRPLPRGRRPATSPTATSPLDRLHENLRRCDYPESAGIAGPSGRGPDPVDARRLDQARRTLAEAATLELAGDYRAAETLAEAALASAEALAEGALAAEASLQAGRAAMLLRHRERAARWFVRAEQWALRSGHDEAFADARIERTKVAVLDDEDVTLARELVALVADAVAGLMGEQTRRRADAREVQAMLDRLQGRRPAAIAGYREVLALRSGAIDGSAKEAFRARQNLANVLSQPGATLEGAARGRGAVPSGRRVVRGAVGRRPPADRGGPPGARALPRRGWRRRRRSGRARALLAGGARPLRRGKLAGRQARAAGGRAGARRGRPRPRPDGH
jgi:tRNA A-37 threonylcarbamoyl transferase component Bud32